MLAAKNRASHALNEILASTESGGEIHILRVFSLKNYILKQMTPLSAL